MPIPPTPDADRRPRTGAPVAQSTDQASVRASVPRRRLGVGASAPSAVSPTSAASSVALDLGQVASSCSAVGAAVTTATRQLRVDGQLDAGRQLDVAGGDLGARLQALDRHLEGSGSWMASAVTDEGVVLVHDQGVPGGLAGQLTGTSTVTFSPRRTISRSTCSKVSLIGSRWIAFGSASACGAVGDVDGEDLVGRRGGSRRRTPAPAARCAWASRRGRTARRAPCRPGAYGGHHPCRTRCGARR